MTNDEIKFIKHIQNCENPAAEFKRMVEYIAEYRKNKSNGEGEK